MIAKNNKIYRPEFFEAQRSNDKKSILLKSSFNQHVLLCFSVLLLLMLSLFVIFAEYTRRESLIGVVSPIGGVVSVKTQSSGHIYEHFLSEGDRVSVGQKLFRVKSELYDYKGQGLKEEVLRSIDERIKNKIKSKEKESERIDREVKYHTDEIERLGGEIELIEEIIFLSKRELDISQDFYIKNKKLNDKSFVTDIELKKISMDVLDKKSNYKKNSLELLSLKRQIQKYRSKIDSLGFERDIILNSIEQNIEEIKKEKAEFLFGSNSQTISPVDGTLASVIVDKGHPVSSGQTVLMIIPDGEACYVELYSPSRNIGFIKPGQVVRIKFDAFPYEKFGIQPGTVISVSKTAVSSDMLTNKKLIAEFDNGGYYKVTIKLDKPTITVYGREALLIPGMTAEADIELETRRVYEWIFEPIFRLKGNI